MVASIHITVDPIIVQFAGFGLHWYGLIMAVAAIVGTFVFARQLEWRGIERGPASSGRLLPDVAASTGSACHSGGTEPSPVLAAMGVPREVGAGAVRLSLGRMTTQAELEALVERLTEVLPAEGG